MPDRPYSVTGIDHEGDRHSFASADAERAAAMARQFEEDLDDVRLSEPLQLHLGRGGETASP